MTDNAPSNAPIILTLDAPRAAMLMRVTSAYSCRTFQDRLDYAIAELIFLQAIHGTFINGGDASEIAEATYTAHQNIEEAIAYSVQETLND